MNYEVDSFEREGWTEEDFSDLPTRENLQRDPWETLPAESMDEAHNPSQLAQGSPILEEPQRQPKSTVDDTLSFQESPGSLVGPQSEEDSFVWRPPNSLTDLTDSHGWDEELLDEDGANEQFVPDDNSYDNYESEFALLADFQSDLGEALYELNGSPPDWAQSIAIDEFISQLKDVSVSQRQEISDLLLNLSRPRLSSWLPWLSGHEWTARTLLLFLQFRAYWDENCELWASLRWSPVANHWFTFLNRSTLTLEDTYLLVQRRLDWPAHQLIDAEWFDDWDEIDVWVRVSQGFFSFASFALYRSRLNFGEDWRCRPDLTVDLDSPLSELGVERNGWELLLNTDWARLSFEGGNGADPMEWHGGHGW